MPTNFYPILNFSFKSEPYEVRLPPGHYLFEAWGASGSTNKCQETKDLEQRGRGGYTKGVLALDHYRTFFVYVGESGNSDGCFNAQMKPYEKASTKSGGATDFRLDKGENWSIFSSLKSRIMVAGGGGATDCFTGGDAGGLVGEDGDYREDSVIKSKAKGGNQKHGGSRGEYMDDRYGYDGRFGIGGSGACPNNFTCDGAGAGGGGYFGGGGMAGEGGGAGGSSYISGHPGCYSIDEDAENEEELNPQNNPNHYSGLIFNETLMLNGSETVPLPLDPYNNQTGNSGDGYARITFLDPIIVTYHHKLNIQKFGMVFLSIMISKYQY